MIKNIQRFRKYSRLLKEQTPGKYKAYLAVDGNAKLAAQRLHAGIYLDRGYIQSHQVDERGRIHADVDSHRLHSEYFVVTETLHRGERIVATARQINADKSKRHHSFQTFEGLELTPSARKRILGLDPHNCVEISGLAKAPRVTTYAVFLLYRLMWHHSLKRNHKIWLMACDRQLLGRLRGLFGNALVALGEPQFYKGHEVVPVMVGVEESLEVLLRQRRTLNPFKRMLARQLIAFFLRGLPAADSARIPPGARKSL